MYIWTKHPFLMAIAYVYKGKVETHVLLTKNESWINSSHFHNILMKLERNDEIIYSMEVMSTTATTATTAAKWQFRFTRGFMLFLKLKGFYSGASNVLDIFKCPRCHF